MDYWSNHSNGLGLCSIILLLLSLSICTVHCNVVTLQVDMVCKKLDCDAIYLVGELLQCLFIN